MKETLNIIINNPALWFFAFTIIIFLYGTFKYITPWFFEKPESGIDWLSRIGIVLVITGIITMLIK